MRQLPDSFTELRITWALVRLLCIPESEPGPRMVSLARIGSYEVRMFEPSQTDSPDAPLFWMELFDHDMEICIDSCVCRSIKEAAAMFEHFISSTGNLE
jgi:hypothetical protein